MTAVISEDRQPLMSAADDILSMEFVAAEFPFRRYGRFQHQLSERPLLYEKQFRLFPDVVKTFGLN